MSISGVEVKIDKRTNEGTICFDIDIYGGDLMELMGTSHINIRYKDITYKKLPKTGVDKFVLDKKVTVQIRKKDRSDDDEIRNKKIMTIQSNDIDMKFHIEGDHVYNNIILSFKKAIAEIKHALLNTLNMLDPNSRPMALFSTFTPYLTGHNGTAPQQRAQIGERPEIREHGGKRKTRKQRK